MKRIPLKDTERYTLERFRQCKKTERHLAWLKSRKAGVGGSDMSTILGLNAFKTPYDLWLEKTGCVEPEDISDKWAIVKGNALENELRKRFRSNHPEMLVTDGTDKQFISREKPYLRASLDGTLQKENGDFGILEIKTASNRRAGDWHDEDGIYRDAQGALWVHCIDSWKQLFVSYGARTLDLGIARTWKSLIKDCAPTERMPFRFITPLTEEEENF